MPTSVASVPSTRPFRTERRIHGLDAENVAGPGTGGRLDSSIRRDGEPVDSSVRRRGSFPVVDSREPSIAVGSSVGQ